MVLGGALTHHHASPLQLLENPADGHGEGEGQLAAALPGVRGGEDGDVGPGGRTGGAGLGTPGVVVLDQVLQVARQQHRLTPQRLHAGHVEDLGGAGNRIFKCLSKYFKK